MFEMLQVHVRPRYLGWCGHVMAYVSEFDLCTCYIRVCYS